ncbi:MAG: FixH family protein [Gammaproteobacteria bacterium]|nr:FixH family protein [Gammaproteobacteria bacterium]
MTNTIVLSKNNKPWYRFPLVWMLVAIPFSAVIMGVVMVWLAVDTNDGLVVDDYYKQGLEINRVIERDKKAAELGISAVIVFDNSARIIKTKFDKGSLVTFPERLQVQLQHATRANSDISIWLDHGIDNQYIGYLDHTITEGIWYFQISGSTDTGDGWRVDARSRVGPKNVIHLQSDYE